MRTPDYSAMFSVIMSHSRDDMFYLNMRVFRLLPPGKEVSVEGAPLLVWCAVYSEEAPLSAE